MKFDSVDDGAEKLDDLAQQEDEAAAFGYRPIGLQDSGYQRVLKPRTHPE